MIRSSGKVLDPFNETAITKDLVQSRDLEYTGFPVTARSHQTNLVAAFDQSVANI